jgi:hypothetical protein
MGFLYLKTINETLENVSLNKINKKKKYFGVIPSK